jgi:hypothetical protein
MTRGAGPEQRGGRVAIEEPATTGAGLSRKLIAALIGLAALASLYFAALSGWLVPRHSQLTEGLARGAALGLAIVLVGLALWVLLGVKLVTVPPDPIYQPDIEWLARLQEVITAPTYDHQGALTAFIELVTNPAEFRSRVAETIDLEGRGIHQRVSVEFVLPVDDIDSEHFFLPILTPVKGDLVDNFRLFDGSGGSLTNLSYQESVELAAIGLRVLLIAATNKQYSEWATRTRSAELIMLQLVARRGPSDINAVKATIKNALKLLERKASRDARELIMAYLGSLSVSYPIVAVVPKSLVVLNRVLLRYEQTVIPSSQTAGLSGKLRVGIGVRPSQVTIPVDLAMTAASYHLRINGPPEKYVVEQILRCADCRTRLRRVQTDNEQVSCVHARGNGDPGDSHFHLRGRFGQSFTHLYMRGYASQAYKDLRLEILVRFNETPPGSRAAAAATALTAAIFIWVIGHLTSDSDVISNSDLPAILLALPAVAASWFGLAAGSEALVGSSLHARLSFVFTGVLSVSSVVIYLLQDGSAKGDAGQLLTIPGRVEFAGITNLEWIGLLAGAFLSLAYISWHFLAHIRSYIQLIRRSDPLTQTHSVG